MNWHSASGPSAVYGVFLKGSQESTPMRLIERKMNSAIANGKNWQLDNTSVLHRDDVVEVRLYGNLIAEIGEGFITLYDGNHRTVTTKSRLNAILYKNGKGNEYVFQRNYEWKIAYDGKTEPFQSGMTI